MKNIIAFHLKEAAASIIGYRKLVTAMRKVFHNYPSGIKPGGKRILFFTMGYFQELNPFEILLMNALALRGHECRSFLCDHRLPVCDMRFIDINSPNICVECCLKSRQLLKTSNLPSFLLSEHTNDEDTGKAEQLVPGTLESVGGFTYEGINFGTLVRVSLFHYLRCGHEENTREFVSLYRELVKSALLLYWAQLRIVEEFKPDIVVAVNGLFFQGAVLVEIAKRKDIRYITYEKGYMSDTYIFDDALPVGRLDTSALWAQFKNEPLTADENLKLDTYLEGRKYSKQAAVQLWTNPEFNVKEFKSKHSIGSYKKVFCVFTNILWDAAVIGRDHAFKSLPDWLKNTIEYFGEKQKDSFLIIRVHPAEIRINLRESREKVIDFIKSTFKELPPNILLVPPDDPTSSYVLMELADCVMVNSSIAGLEGACYGKPVIVVGKTHYRGYGFTLDASNPEEYFKMIEQIMKDTVRDEISKEMARRYAFTFFFRFMVKLPYFKQKQGKHNPVQLAIKKRDVLAPGHNRNLDMICGFISGSSGKDKVLNGE